MHQLRCELRRRRTAHRKRDGVATQRAGRRCSVGIFGHQRSQHWAPTCSLQQILSAAMRCERWCVRCMCFAFAVGERAQPHAPLLMSRQRATDKGGTALVCLWYSVACQALSTLVTVWLIAVVIFNSIKPTAYLFGFDTCVRCVSCAMHFVLGACRVRCDLFTRCVECDSMQRVHLRFSDFQRRVHPKTFLIKNKKEKKVVYYLLHLAFNILT